MKTDGFYTVFKDVDLGEERLRRMKSPEQIAEAALWIAAQDASTFTGRSVNDDEVRSFIEGRAKP